MRKQLKKKTEVSRADVKRLQRYYNLLLFSIGCLRDPENMRRIYLYAENIAQKDYMDHLGSDRKKILKPVF